MVTKVGSAGHVVDSVIQYGNQKTDNASNEKHESGDKNVKSHSSPERVIGASEIVSAGIKVPRTHKKSDSQIAAEMSREAVSIAKADVASEQELIKRDNTAMELSQEAIKITVEDVNKKLAPTGSSIQFAYHEKTGRYSFKVLDAEGKILREVPPEKSLDMVAKMFEMAGILVDEKR